MVRPLFLFFLPVSTSSVPTQAKHDFNVKKSWFDIVAGVIYAVCAVSVLLNERPAWLVKS
jgi:hypothetical protein